MNRRAGIRLLFIFSIFILALAGCSTPPAVVENPSPTAPGSTATPPEAPTQTPSATLLPRPEAVLVVPEGADPALAQELGTVVSELAAGQGYDFRTTTGLDQGSLTPGLKTAVVLPPLANLAELAAASPKTQFIAVGFPDLTPTGNLSIISPQGSQTDQQGFLAGYLAGVVTPDWRAGVISAADLPEDQAARQGFLNGVVFYCGLCRPAFPPFGQYPLAVELPSGSGFVEQQGAAEPLIAQGVTTIYLAPGADSPELREYLAQQGVNLIGGSAPAETIKPNWIATIQADWLAEVRQAWEAAVSGQPYEPQNTALAITDVNESILTEGRLRVVEQIRDELASGLIDTGAGQGDDVSY